jgi:hypothetical protein
MSLRGLACSVFTVFAAEGLSTDLLSNERKVMKPRSSRPILSFALPSDSKASVA